MRDRTSQRDLMELQRKAVHDGLPSIAGAILAINSSQIKYDWKNNRIEREKDISAVVNYFPDINDASYLPKDLKLEASRMVVDQFSDMDVPDELKNKVKEVAKRYKKELEKSSQYNSLKSFSSY